MYRVTAEYPNIKSVSVADFDGTNEQDSADRAMAYADAMTTAKTVIVWALPVAEGDKHIGCVVRRNYSWVSEETSSLDVRRLATYLDAAVYLPRNTLSA